MRKAMVATMLSAFLFPGSGHLVLKKYLMGSALISVSLLLSSYLFLKLIAGVLNLFGKLQRNEIMPTLQGIIGYFFEHPFGREPGMAYFCFALAIVIWLFSIVDSYRIGSELDRSQDA